MRCARFSKIEFVSKEDAMIMSVTISEDRYFEYNFNSFYLILVDLTVMWSIHNPFSREESRCENEDLENPKLI